MAKRRKTTSGENVFVVATIVLCFLVTLGLSFAFSGDGFLSLAQVFAKSEERSFYLLAIGGYDDMTIARNTAELVKNRGGAGYVLKGEDGNNIEIIFAAYDDSDAADKVLATVEDRSAYLKTIIVKDSTLKWASGDVKTAAKDALCYFDIAFKTLYETSNSLNDNAVSLEEARTRIRVLSTQIGDIKSIFYSKTAGIDSREVTEIKLALITALALLDNVEYSSVVKACSSMRYQIVQLVLCYQALLSNV